MGGSHMARIQRQPLSQPANRFWPCTALVSSSAMYREEAGTKGEENDGGASGALGFSGSWAALSTGFSECPESPVACLPSGHPQRFFLLQVGV